MREDGGKKCPKCNIWVLKSEVNTVLLLRDVIIWLVSVILNSVIIVGESMKNVNVFKNLTKGTEVYMDND